MGSGYNTSLALGRSARSKAASRTPIHFWLNVPLYRYQLPCSTETSIHEFRSRTPFEHETLVYCRWCGDWRDVRGLEPINSPHSNDERIAFEQDKGLLRERAAQSMLADGVPETEEAIAEFARENGIPVREVKRITAALVAPIPRDAAKFNMCRAGLHELTPDNIKFSRGRRQCKACQNERQKERRARQKG